MPKKNISLILFLSAALFTLVLMAGCGSHETQPMNEDVLKKELFGKVWKLQNLFERSVVGDKELTIEFADDGTVKGFGGCNAFSGAFTLDGEKLTFGPLASTKKFCGAAVGEQEYTFMTFLALIKTIRIDDGELELYSDRHDVPMTFTTGEGGLLW